MRAFDSPETGLLLKTSQKIRIPLVLVFTLIAIALLVISKQRYKYLNWNFAVNNSQQKNTLTKNRMIASNFC